MRARQGIGRTRGGRHGFTLDVAKPVGATNLVVIDGDVMTAVGEPRLQGKAAAE